MQLINTVSASRFSLNGIQFYKNFLSNVIGDYIVIYNAYDRNDVRIEPIHYSEIELDGIVYASATLLQSALIDVIYARSITGGGGGSAVWGGITGTLSSQTDLQSALNAKANVSGQVFTGAISATNLSGTNTGDETTSSIQTKRPLKTVNSQSLEGSGDILIEAFEQYQQTLPTRLTVSSNIDTWRGWSTLVNFMTADANTSYGILSDATFVAGTVSGLFVKNKTALDSLYMKWSNMGPAEIEVQVWLYDIDNTQVSPGARFVNPRKVVSQTFIPQDNTTDQFNFTIASHTLTDKSKFYLFYRFKNASVTPSGFANNIMFKWNFL